MDTLEEKTYGEVIFIEVRNGEAVLDFVQRAKGGMVTFEIYRRFYQGKRIGASKIINKK